MSDRVRDRVQVPEFVRGETGQRLAEFARNPAAFIAVIIVGWVLEIWAFFLDMIGMLFIGGDGWVGLVGLLEVGIIEPLSGVGNAFRIFPELWETVGIIAASAAGQAGIFAPIVGLLIWAFATFMMGLILISAFQLLATYIPIRSVTDPIRTWARGLVGR